MGLFEKKNCDICGKEITIFGNKKVEDGNICRECEAKLSEWFDDRRYSTVEEIKKQLAYREENEKKLETFNPTKIIGKLNKVYIDEEKRLFTVSKHKDWRSNNPDLISFDDVKDIKIKIKEDRKEKKNINAEGKEVSFNPPIYEYEYSFNVEIDVINDYFENIKFELSTFHPREPKGDLYEDYISMSKNIIKTILGKDFEDDQSTFKYYEDEKRKKENLQNSFTSAVLDIAADAIESLINKKKNEKDTD